jgi:deoxyribodipyrimidine photo-lyase
MSAPRPVLVWFRQDLRTSDNPALQAAVKTGRPLLPVYILDDENAGESSPGAASRCWLHHSLDALDQSLDSALYVRRGNASELLPEIVGEHGVSSVFWNRCYEPWRMRRDKALKSRLQDHGCEVHSFNGSLLFEPPMISKADGTPYKVFTPYFRKGCLQNGPVPREPLPQALPDTYVRTSRCGSLRQLELLPARSWCDKVIAEWSPGETGASDRLQRFLEHGLANYKDGRNRPDQKAVSRLSPHLHFGEISPNSAWYAVAERRHEASLERHVDSFQSELGWREFSHYLLYHWPQLPRENLQEKFDRFPWRDDDERLQDWQRGQTGYPIVDAGMRELWNTGYMHNRVRMIVGSFLVKNLRLHWQHGARWFWDTLVDADLANNSAGWQWIAGCGADAAPYFRIFNPVTQGRKFDPDGSYVRRHVPELGGVADRYIHCPWEAPDPAGDYPSPIVDLMDSRKSALAAFKSISQRAD